MKKITCWILLLNSLGAFGQSTEPEARFSCGVSAGAEFQMLNMAALSPRPGGPYLVEDDRAGYGASVGLWGQWPLLPTLSLRPALVFSRITNTLAFQTPDGADVRDRYIFSDLELPVHLVLTNQLSHLPVRPLILFGGRLSWNLAPNTHKAALYILPERLSVDIGIGAGIRWGKVLLQPEVIYSYGLNNSHDFRDSPYDWAVGRIVRDRVSVRVVVVVDN